MRTIELQTAVPGPRSAEILRRKEQVVADPLSIYAPVVIESARGATVTDVDGNNFIAFEGGFHGRTLLSLSLTSKVHPYKAGLGPFAPEVYRVPFPNDYRGPDARTALEALERAFVTQVPAEQVAAIVIEPIQGEGGFL